MSIYLFCLVSFCTYVLIKKKTFMIASNEKHNFFDSLSIHYLGNSDQCKEKGYNGVAMPEAS